jgi:hypothetical protein
VAGRLVAQLLRAGEAVVWVPPKLMAKARASARTRGKSDPIDALAVARAALREPSLSPPSCRVRRWRCGWCWITARTWSPNGPGCSIGCAGTCTTLTPSSPRRWAQFAMHAGVAPIPVWSGNTSRHRLNRGGNRQLNAAIHRVAVTQLRAYRPAQALMTRRIAAGNSKPEALRVLNRHLADVLYAAMCSDDQAVSTAMAGQPAAAWHRSFAWSTPTPSRSGDRRNGHAPGGRPCAVVG